MRWTPEMYGILVTACVAGFAACSTEHKSQYRNKIDDSKAATTVTAGAISTNLEEAADATLASKDSTSSQTAAPTTTCAAEVFAQTVWAPVISPTCLNCHISNGFASKRGDSLFQLRDQSQPDYIAHNLAAFSKVASLLTSDGLPLVLAKPTMKTQHIGGKLIDVDSAAFKAISSFIGRRDLTGPCTSLTQATRDKLQLKTNTQVIHQAALQLAGRQPTIGEQGLAAAGQLDQALTTVLAGSYFKNYIKLIYNDVLLTDKYRWDNLIEAEYRVDGLINSSWRNNDLWSGQHGAFPLYESSRELIAYVIMNDKPYTDILTANYMMMTPHMACDFFGSGHPVPFTTSCTLSRTAPANDCTVGNFSFGDYNLIDDCREFLPATPPKSPRPYVGILSDIALLNIVSTTPSNLNRHRSNFFYKNFLGLDIQSLGAILPPNSDTSGADPAATMNNPACAACHALVDPLASAMKNFDAGGNYSPPTAWPQTMFGPGWNGQDMPPMTTEEPLSWVAKQIVADPRFATTAVTFWYSALTGRQPLQDPSPSSVTYASDLAAKLAQNSFFDQLAHDFVANGFNTRQMIKSLIISPYYTAAGYKGTLTSSEQAMLSSFDHASRRRPEEMYQAHIAVTGSYWWTKVAPTSPTAQGYTTFQHWYNSYLQLNLEFLLSAGGIDSQSTAIRNNDMNAVTATIYDFAASDMPCKTVAADFNMPAAQRLMFPKVQLDDLPGTVGGSDNIKSNIKYLHQLVLGEMLPDTDPELQETYRLFTQLYNNRLASGDHSLDSSCASGGITSDPSYTLHAWMGVLDYLMDDFDFLYQ